MLFAVCGVLAVFAMPVPGADRLPLGLVGAADLGVAAAALLLPWHRWPARATLVLALPAFAIIGGSNAAGLLPPRALSLMFVLVFVWVGSHHRRWQSLWLAPLAAGAHALSVQLDSHGLPVDPRAVVMVFVVCVLVAETVARSQERLRSSEAEMRFLVEHSTDLVTRVGLDEKARQYPHQLSAWTA